MAQRVAYENLIYNEILRFQLVVLRGVNRVLAKWATVAIMHPQYVHADIHVIQYKPGSDSELYIGTDGGVFGTRTASAPACAN